MRRDLTEIVFILDKSGSMAGKEGDVIGGYNAFLKTQLMEPGETMVTTVLFNDRYFVLYNGVAAEKAAMEPRDYSPEGTTALLDAVGKTILELSSRITRTPEFLSPRKVIVVITTDGLENASREFDKKQIKELINRQRTMHDWSFIFLGADIDAYAEASAIGINDKKDVYSYETHSVSYLEAMSCASNMVLTRRRKKTEK